MKIVFKKDGLEAKELAFANGLEETLNAAFAESQKNSVDSTTLQQKLTEISKTIIGKGLSDEEFKTFNETVESVKAHAIALQKIKDGGVKEATSLRQSIKEQLQAYIKANPEKWEAFKSRDNMSFGTTTVEDVKGKKEVGAGIELNFKAAATMTVSGSSNGSAFVPTIELVPGLVPLFRNTPFLENYANVSSTSNTRIVWTEKTNPQGQAAMTPEGGLKPLISFEYKTNESSAKKVTDKIKVSTEMLDDIDFMAGEIENELKYQVDMKVDAQLLNGDGVGTNLKGVTQYAGAYVLTTIKTPTPTNADAIRAAAAQVVTLNFRANYAFVNPVEGANMDLTKNNQGSYIIPPFQSTSGLVIAGVQVVETNQIAAGALLLGDMTMFKVRNYRPFSIQYGWVNDDFELNLITIIGERRLHAYIYDNTTGAFVFDTFANIKTALTPAA